MNCCNHNCNQGRNCPARVAKIGRKDYAKEPYPPSSAPRCIKRAAKWALIGIAAALFAAAAVLVGVRA
jgi:hypothetical protein